MQRANLWPKVTAEGIRCGLLARKRKSRLRGGRELQLFFRQLTTAASEFPKDHMVSCVVSLIMLFVFLSDVYEKSL